MLEGARLVSKIRGDLMKHERPSSPRKSPLTSGVERPPESLGNYGTGGVLTVPYARELLDSYKFAGSRSRFFRHRFLTSASSCRHISFVKAGGEPLELSDESLQDLMRMLNFRSEPCYQRPYRLIADSRLCIKVGFGDILGELRYDHEDPEAGLVALTGAL